MEVLSMRDRVQNDQNYINSQQPILQETIQNQSPPPPPPSATASPPSATASPTHEFSFTISLNPHPPPKSTKNDGIHKHNTCNTHNNYNENHQSLAPPREPPLTAIDLSPADDIFYHGHLLPLHLLSHLPTSPRSSTNSMDSFTLPMKDILKDQNNPIGNTSFNSHYYHHRNTFSDFNLPNNNINQTRPKSKSFSIFTRPRWKKGPLDEREAGQEEKDQETNNNNNDNNNNSKKKLKLEVAQLIKRYMKMVKPYMSFTKAKRNSEFNRPQPHSFSGILPSSNRVISGKRGKFSAPVSMKTSPTNSGILLASGTVSPAISTTSDSTMEELQAAIQAAIAHCKNSIAIEDKVDQV